MPRTLIATDGFRDLVQYDEESIRVENPDLGICSVWLSKEDVATLLAAHCRGEEIDCALDEVLEAE